MIQAYLHIIILTFGLYEKPFTGPSALRWIGISLFIMNQRLFDMEKCVLCI